MSRASIARGWRTQMSRRDAILPNAPAAGRGPRSDHAGEMTGGMQETLTSGSPWQGVNWSLTYVGLLAYLWIVTTFSFQGGDIAMAIAIFGLVLQRDPFVFPPFLWLYSAFILWSVVGYLGTDYSAVVGLRLDTAWK